MIQSPNLGSSGKKTSKRTNEQKKKPFVSTKTKSKLTRKRKSGATAAPSPHRNCPSSTHENSSSSRKKAPRLAPQSMLEVPSHAPPVKAQNAPESRFKSTTSKGKSTPRPKRQAEDPNVFRVRDVAGCQMQLARSVLEPLLVIMFQVVRGEDARAALIGSSCEVCEAFYRVSFSCCHLTGWCCVI